jgi:type VI secretion system secreted protein Hcp
MYMRAATTNRTKPPLALEPLEDRTMMAFDVFLKIDGIEGDVVQKKHKGSFEIDSVSWGASNAGAGILNPGTVPPEFGLHVTTPKGKAKDKLFLMCATGEHIKKATLILRKAGGGKQDYYKITMSDCIITSYQAAPPTGGSGSEALTFSFGEIKVVYQAADDPRKTVVDNPAPDATGLDLNGDGTGDPMFFAYASVWDYNDDLVYDCPLPGDNDADMKMDAPPLVDLNGDKQRDDATVGFDADGDGTPNLLLPLDFNGDGRPDIVVACDSNDGRVDDLFFADFDADGKADIMISRRACLFHLGLKG